MSEAEELVKRKRGRENIELICKGNICLTEDGRIVVDLRNTECPPEKARKFLEPLLSGKDVEWKMPKLVERKEPKGSEKLEK